MICLKEPITQPRKSEIIWFCTTTNLRRLQRLDHALNVGSVIIISVDVIHDLGVLLDSKLTMKKHTDKIASVYFYLFWQLKQFVGYLIQLLQLNWFLPSYFAGWSYIAISFWLAFCRRSSLPCRESKMLQQGLSTRIVHAITSHQTPHPPASLSADKASSDVQYLAVNEHLTRMPRFVLHRRPSENKNSLYRVERVALWRRKPLRAADHPSQVQR